MGLGGLTGMHAWVAVLLFATSFAGCIDTCPSGCYTYEQWPSLRARRT